jgi:hypothetical protein
MPFKSLYVQVKNPYSPLAIPLTFTPSLIINLNLPLPFEVLLESPNSDLLIVGFL